MIFALPLLTLFATAASAQGLDQQLRQQQAEKEKILAICKKQYELAEYISDTKKGKIKFTVSQGKIQGILPKVVRQQTGRHKCDRGKYEKPILLGRLVTPPPITLQELRVVRELEDLRRRNAYVVEDIDLHVAESQFIAGGGDPEIARIRREAVKFKRRQNEEKIALDRRFIDQEARLSGGIYQPPRFSIVIERCPSKPEHSCLIKYEQSPDGEISKEVLAKGSKSRAQL